MAEGERILIADDHPLMRSALRHAVAQGLPGCEVTEVGTLDAAADALRAAPADRPFDLVLLDLAMPGASGLAGLFLLRAEFPSTAVVIVSANEDPATIRRAADCGAAGFIPKSTLADRIVEAVRAVMRGEFWFETLERGDATAGRGEDAALAVRLASLTPQQFRVLVAITEGKLNKQIAHELGVGEATVKAHVTEILRKQGVISRTQAAIAARELLAGPAGAGSQPEPA